MRNIIEKNLQARQRSDNFIGSQQLALYKRPRPDLLLPALENRNSMSTMTQRFQSLYQQQVEKGRNIDIRA